MAWEHSRSFFKTYDTTMEDNLWYKTTFDGRQPWWKATFDGRQPLIENNLWWKTTFDGRWPMMEDNLWWKTTFNWILLLADCIGMIWDDRVAKQRSSLRKCRTELKARNSLLKSTRWKHYRLQNSALLLAEALNVHFVWN